MQHNDEIPVPTYTTISEPFLSSEEENINSTGCESYDYDENMSRLSQFSQEELNDLIRDLSLSKRDSEILASRLREKKQRWN